MRLEQVDLSAGAAAMHQVWTQPWVARLVTCGSLDRSGPHRLAAKDAALSRR